MIEIPGALTIVKQINQTIRGKMSIKVLQIIDLINLPGTMEIRRNTPSYLKERQ
ncbi:hypothetical protein [Clostridium thermarum]|uniref:hypothetical protein n=1 Tax=Clostridium thermarum TaxID=1716543 RepID=UPI0013D6DC91|nr:hypothetical protein [Clostridium thermarum]